MKQTENTSVNVTDLTDVLKNSHISVAGQTIADSQN